MLYDADRNNSMADRWHHNPLVQSLMQGKAMGNFLKMGVSLRLRRSIIMRIMDGGLLLIEMPTTMMEIPHFISFLLRCSILS